MMRNELRSLQDIPNVGAAIESLLMRLGIDEPSDLAGRDPYQMYTDLCRLTRRRHDPCILDVFISAVRYMEGGPAKKWWQYTQERKEKMRGN